jgi:plastocyanin
MEEAKKMNRCLIAFVVLASGCIGRSEAGALPESLQRPAQRGAQAAAAPGEATLSGRVTWHGAHPPMAPIALTGNTAGCGTSVPFAALEIGADQGVAGAVITVEGAHGTVAPATVTIDQHGCDFGPHVVVVPVGGRLNFTNHDTVLHSVHAFRGAASEFNLATPPGLALARPMTAAGLLRLQCDIGHTWMSGWVHVVDSPFVTVTDAHGAYHIPHLPPGTYRVTMWHEGWTTRPSSNSRPAYSAAVSQTETVTIPASGDVERSFTLQ